MEINNVNDLSKIMQPVLVGLVDQLANRVYETLNFFLQSYYDSYNPVSYRRQYDFLRSAIKVKGRMSRGKAVAYRLSYHISRIGKTLDFPTYFFSINPNPT